MSRCQRECHRFEPDILLHIMKKLLLALLTISSTSYACTGYVIAFKGQHDIFDHKAFYGFYTNIGYCGIAYSWQDSKQAVNFINQIQVPYQLYGYSMGASTISKLLKSDQLNYKLPEYIITIGAYKTTDVDFTKYNIKYDNYFDQSGQTQKSPGVFLNVPHNKIQTEVNNRRVGIVAVP